MRNHKINIYDKQKVHKLPTGIRLLVRRACIATLKSEGFFEPAEIDVTFVDDETIKELNTVHRGIEKSTDVLSFPLSQDGEFDVNYDEDTLLLGDVIISVDHAFSQAELYGHTIQREIAFLTVHSVLHLLGYDHEESKLQDSIMNEKQEKILEEIGLSIVK